MGITARCTAFNGITIFSTFLTFENAKIHKKLLTVMQK